MCVLHHNHSTCNKKLQTSERFLQATFLFNQKWLDFGHTGVNNDNLLSYLTDIWAHLQPKQLHPGALHCSTAIILCIQHLLHNEKQKQAVSESL